jgi:drug/metabolite transporter (DMT)-like permease
MQAAEPPFHGAGEWAALGGAVVWAFASVLYARSFRRGGPLDAVWFKNVVSTVILSVIALLIGKRFGGGLPASHEFGWILGSGLFGMCFGDWLYFVAISKLGVSRAIILTMATPALTAIFAWLIFAEQLQASQWIGVLLVVSGGILVESRRLGRPPRATTPDSTAAHQARAQKIGYLAAAGATLSWTVGNLIIHNGLRETGAVTGGALRLAAGTFGFAVWFVLRGQLRQQLRKLGTWDSWRQFAIPTLLGTVVGMSLYVAGFKWAPQGVAASLSSTVPLFALPLSIWLLGEKQSWRGWLGGAVVVLGVFLVGDLLSLNF